MTDPRMTEGGVIHVRDGRRGICPECHLGAGLHLQTCELGQRWLAETTGGALAPEQAATHAKKGSV